MTTKLSQPVQQSDRLITLDIIRGVALLGILLMNIQSFSMVLSAYGNPTSYGDLSGINFYVYYFSHLFADQKFMTIFSLLFGAGVVLMTDNFVKKQGSPVKIHFRRMAILAMFGLGHAYLLWYGDILFAYAISGMLVYGARNKSPKFLIILGFVLITLSSLIIYAVGVSLPYWDATDVQQVQDFWAPSIEAIKQDIAANQSSWFGQMEERHKMAAEMYSHIPFYLPRVIGLILLGMACLKLKLFGNRYSSRSLVISGVCTIITGLSLIIIGNVANFASNWPLESLFIGTQYNYWGSIAMAYGYIALLIVFCRSMLLGKVKTWLANVGKMALTNYLSQTLICGFIFYGWGLGLFGTVTRTEQLLIVLAVWLVQIGFSNYWMQHFHFGPFEWLWRSMTYGRRQPLRKINKALAVTING